MQKSHKKKNSIGFGQILFFPAYIKIIQLCIFITLIHSTNRAKRINNVSSKHESGIVSPIVRRFSRQIEHILYRMTLWMTARPLSISIFARRNERFNGLYSIISLYTGWSWKEKRMEVMRTTTTKVEKSRWLINYWIAHEILNL